MVVSKRNCLYLILFFICIAVGIILYWLVSAYQQTKIQNEALNLQLRQANEEKKEATVIRRVSLQLEEIAYQQKDISDKQRQEAVYQTQIANQMRRHAEEEREKALVAQEEAINAYDQMEAQKRIAEKRQQEAILARQKADTLACLALGRSLGTLAVTQYATGNKDLASLLAYSSWKFTAENGGDVYQPAIFDALSVTSSMTKYFTRHQGAIRDMQLVVKDKLHPYLLTVSQSGEIIYWTPEDESDSVVHSEYLFNDLAFDFRKVYVDVENSLIYALSFTGFLVVINEKKQVRIIPVEEQELIGMAVTSSHIYVASRKGTVLRTDLSNLKFQPFYTHSQSLSLFQQSGEMLFLGDVTGCVCELSEATGKVNHYNKVDVHEPVTALCLTPKKDKLAVGYKSGVIHCYDLHSEKVDELIGHISAVTHIEFVDGRFASSSYDCSVRLWNLDSEKIVSAIVSQPGEWIHVFCMAGNMLQLLIGSDKGTIHIVSISPSQMAERVKKELTRDFTQEEWAYYVGGLREYESYCSSSK